MNKSIGALELRSISKGIEVANEIVKKSNVEIIYFRTICPGKFIVIVTGDEGEINEAIEYGVQISENYLVDSFCVHAVTPSIVDAFRNRYITKTAEGSLGVMEAYSVCSGIKALDATMKSGAVKLLKLHIAFAIGGKLVYVVTGPLSSVEYGMAEGRRSLGREEKTNVSIIRSPSEDMLLHLHHI